MTDVLGVAPLGAMSGDGQFFPTDHTEYISLPGALLAPKPDASGSGAYEVHLTEELSEVSYFDQVQLMAVDHPAGCRNLFERKMEIAAISEVPVIWAEPSASIRSRPTRRTTAMCSIAFFTSDKRYVDDFEHNYIGVAQDALRSISISAKRRRITARSWC